MVEATQVYVFCPAGNATGGTELLHQLSHKLALIPGVRSSIIYWPFSSGSTTNAAFASYNVSVASPSDVGVSDVVILPEVFSHLRERFSKSRIFIWWLSVDNYYFSLDKGRWRLNKFLLTKFRSQSYMFFEKSLRLVEGHLCQSNYAMQHLQKKNIDRRFFLGDYLNASFLAKYPQTEGRSDIVVYNPKKGARHTEKLMSAHPDILFRPIENMDRRQVVDLLKSAKVYLDLGYHPGMDRIPREAAALGCIVLTSTMGSAGNKDDLPICDSLKFSLDSGFEGRIGEKIRAVFRDFPKFFRDFDGYRDFIWGQELAFEHDLERFAVLIGSDKK